MHHTQSRVINPLPGPLARQYPFPWHLLDLDPAPPRPDFEPRPTRDGIVTDEAHATATHLSLRAAGRVYQAKQTTEQQPAEDDSDPPF